MMPKPIREALEVFKEMLAPLGFDLELQTGKKHMSIIVSRDGVERRAMLACSPRTDNIRTYARQQVQRLLRDWPEGATA